MSNLGRDNIAQNSYALRVISIKPQFLMMQITLPAATAWMFYNGYHGGGHPFVISGALGILLSCINFYFVGPLGNKLVLDIHGFTSSNVGFKKRASWNEIESISRLGNNSKGSTIIRLKGRPAVALSPFLAGDPREIIAALQQRCAEAGNQVSMAG